MYYNSDIEVGLGVFFGIMIFILMISIAVPLIVGILVYRDAKKRVDASPVLFGLLAALAPLFIGVIVYMIIRKDYPLKPEYGGPENPGYGRNNDYGAGYGGGYSAGQTGEASYSGTGGQNYGYASGDGTESGDETAGVSDGESQSQPQSSYTYYAQPSAPKKNGIPTWAKILIVIAIVLVVIGIIAFFVSLYNAIFGYASYYGSYSGDGLYFHGIDL